MILIVNAWSFTSLAQSDMTLGASFRSFPLSGTLETSFGYGQLIWGARDSWLYGFARGSLGVDASVGYDAETAMLELFPISILGIRLGKMWSENHADYEAYNCNEYLCRGTFVNTFIEIPLYLSYWGVIFAASWRSETWESTEHLNIGDKHEYVEPTSGLPLSVHRRRNIDRVRFVLAYQFTENWRFGVTQVEYTGQSSEQDGIPGDTGTTKDNHARLRAAIGQYRFKGLINADSDFSLLFGVGEFYSKLKFTEPTAFVSISFSPWPKLGF
jgi:hypothetical protein